MAYSFRRVSPSQQGSEGASRRHGSSNEKFTSQPLAQIREGEIEVVQSLPLIKPTPSDMFLH